MNKEKIYYNRMFGYKKINYNLSTRTIKTFDKKVKTYYYAEFDDETIAVDKEEYDCLLKELEEK